MASISTYFSSFSQFSPVFSQNIAIQNSILFQFSSNIECQNCLFPSMALFFTNFYVFFHSMGSIFTYFFTMTSNFTYFFIEFLARENVKNFFRTLKLRTLHVLALFSANFQIMASFSTNLAGKNRNSDRFYEPFL